MPEKLPEPEAGTEEQAAPKSMLAALALAIGADEDVIGALEVVDEDAVDDPLELHAASPALSATAATAAGTRRRFIRIPDMGISLLSDVGSAI
ncbi:MAG TPA: hypothetical protein VFN97_19200 [Actinospica sp.]|nr:hypothetical protein [Actinospica sp.]